MAVTPFRFNEDKYGETREVYIGILSKLGIESPQEYLDAKIATIPEEDRNGLMFNKIIGEQFKNEDERKKRASEIVESLLGDKSVSPYIIGYFAEMAGDYIPFDTVLTAGMTVGEGKSLQMGCGEGKTGVLSLAAYAKLANNANRENSEVPPKQIFLTSSTPILAAEALDKLEFYNKVGIGDQVTLISSEGITRAKLDKDGRVIVGKDGKVEREPISFEDKTQEEIRALLMEAYQSPLVSSDNATLMQHAMQGYLPRPEEIGVERELLADEADFVLLDSYRPLQQTEEMSEKEKKDSIIQRTEAYEILRSLDKEGLYVLDDANQYVDFTEEGKAQIVELINERYGGNPNIDKNRIYDYVYDALVAETVYRENRDYQILDGGKKIVSEDRASGISIDLPQGVKQALEIKLQREGKYVGEISEERAVLDTLNVQNFFGEYFNGRKHFVSGTLGIDSEEIAEEIEDNFGVSKNEGDIYEIPPKGKGIRDDQGKTMFRGQKEKRTAIIDNALKEIQGKRPVLIGAISEEEIQALQTELQGRNLEESPRVLIYTAASEDIFARDKEELSKEEFETKYGVSKETYKKYEKLIKYEAGKENTITIGTSIIGRGTTIKTNDEVNESGGIHVIIDGLHETSSRNQEQYKARTARGTDAGSTKEFFSLEDIPEEYRSEFEERIDDPDGVYRDVYKKIDARTRSIRQYVVELVDFTRAQMAGVEEYVDLTEEQKAEVKQLIVTRAFAIKNRACGVSDRFEERFEQYKREIEGYANLYVARYQNRDEKFDETQWLIDNGYEDMAKKYIPFSQEREEQIFTKAGIKQQASKARKGKLQEMTSQTRNMVLEDRKAEQIQENGDERND